MASLIGITAASIFNSPVEMKRFFHTGMTVALLAAFGCERKEGAGDSTIVAQIVPISYQATWTTGAVISVFADGKIGMSTSFGDTLQLSKASADRKLID